MQNMTKYNHLRSILFVGILYFILPLSAHTQVSVNRFMGKEIKYIDIASAIRNSSPVFISEDTCRTGTISAVHSRNHKGILYVYTCSCQPDSIRLIFTSNKNKHPDIIHRESLYAPDSIVSQGINVCSTNDRKGNDILFLFTRNGTMHYSLLNETEQSGWSNFNLLNGYCSNGISSVFRNRHGELIAFFGNSDLSTSSGRKPIYKIKSYDQGLSWSLPEIAVKHNIYDLDYVQVTRSEQGKQNVLYMLAGNSDRSLVFLSISKDEGESWSYPTLLPNFLDGYGHQLSIIGETAYILFADNIEHIEGKFVNHSYGNLLLWKGSVKDLENKNKGTGIYRLAETRTIHSDQLQAVAIPLAKDRLRLVIGPCWNDPDSSFLKSYNLHMETKQ